MRFFNSGGVWFRLSLFISAESENSKHIVIADVNSAKLYCAFHVKRQTFGEMPKMPANISNKGIILKDRPNPEF